jgi:type IV secretion system protein TrbF
MSSTISPPLSVKKKSDLPIWNEDDDQGDNYKSVFLDMRRHWNEHYADYVVRERAWRIIAMISVAVSLVSVCGLVYIGAQNKLVPYVVAVDKLGDAVAVHRADVAARPDAHIIRYQLARWVECVRTVYQDAGAERANFNHVYAMLHKSDAAYTALNQYFNENDPFKRAQTEGASVEINSVLPITESTWQVQWTEKVHTTKGELVSTTPMQANITVGITPSTDEKQLIKNPTGIYIKNFSWSPKF